MKKHKNKIIKNKIYFELIIIYGHYSDLWNVLENSVRQKMTAIFTDMLFQAIPEYIQSQNLMLNTLNTRSAVNHVEKKVLFQNYNLYFVEVVVGFYCESPPSIVKILN